MRAVTLTDTGLRVEDVPRPAPRRGQVLIEVHAAALNRADLLSVEAVAGGRPPGHGLAIGREFAGTVAGVGNGVSGVAVGDAVMCSGGAAFAEYAVAASGRLYPKPPGLSFEEAACLPVALQTMHDAIVTNGRLMPGESVLVQGASSGVGLMALQIARRWGASPVIGTSTNPQRRRRLADFGADVALDPNDPDWVRQVRDATDGRGVDLIIDQVSGAMVEQHLHAAAICGRVVNVGRLGGDTGQFDFDLHALKRITYIGVTFRTRTRTEVDEIVRRAWSDLGTAIERGELALPVDRAFALDEIESALQYMADNRHFGKIVIVPGPRTA